MSYKTTKLFPPRKTRDEIWLEHLATNLHDRDEENKLEETLIKGGAVDWDSFYKIMTGGDEEEYGDTYKTAIRLLVRKGILDYSRGYRISHLVFEANPRLPYGGAPILFFSKEEDAMEFREICGHTDMGITKW